MRLIYLSACLVVLVAVVAAAQTCIIPAPPAPPKPTHLVVVLPSDGGTQGCLASAVVPGGPSQNTYAISNAKCSQAVAIAQQAAANDNGWNDGGTP